MGGEDGGGMMMGWMMMGWIGGGGRGEGGGGRCMRDDSGSGDERWLVDRCVGENAYGILGQDPDVFEGT